ncbi:hypothetical protein L6252_00855 [Candidatus Parcubacteria bacterium]|nr:hypothetical protein [Candidatus Parcubacteria bacterium]
MEKRRNSDLVFAVLMVLAVLVILPSPVRGAGPPENILLNPYFEEGAVGVENWEPEVHSPSFNLTMGKTYTYAMFIKAEPDSVRTLLGVNFEQLDTWVGMGQEIALTDEWVEYHFTGVWANPSSPPAVVVHIGINLQKDDFWISYCRVYKGDFFQEEFGEIPQAVNPMPPNMKLPITWGYVKND